jgi:hypothetical protein
MRRELPEQLRFLASPGAKQKDGDASMLGETRVVTGSTSGVARIVMVARDRAKAGRLRG